MIREQAVCQDLHIVPLAPLGQNPLEGGEVFIALENR
jgi:hypothetical protein